MSDLPKMLQNKLEFCHFIDWIIVRRRVTSYLEIGSKYGGSLIRVAAAMPIGSKIVSVDLEGRDIWKQTTQQLGKHWVAYGMKGDSTMPMMVKAVQLLGPFDVVFIDGGHDEATVRADWANYGPMGKIIAFHDISWVKGTRDIVIDVPKVWAELKTQYRTKEYREEKTDNGIGVLFRDRPLR